MDQHQYEPWTTIWDLLLCGWGFEMMCVEKLSGYLVFHRQGLHYRVGSIVNHIALIYLCMCLHLSSADVSAQLWQCSKTTSPKGGELWSICCGQCSASVNTAELRVNTTQPAVLQCFMPHDSDCSDYCELHCAGMSETRSYLPPHFTLWNFEMPFLDCLAWWAHLPALLWPGQLQALDALLSGIDKWCWISPEPVGKRDCACTATDQP